MSETEDKRQKDGNTSRRAFLGAGLAAGGAVATAGLARAQGAPDPLITEVQPWARELGEGVDADILATTAIFAALSDMVEAYGEEAVADMAGGLVDRVRQGEFTLNRVMN